MKFSAYVVSTFENVYHNYIEILVTNFLWVIFSLGIVTIPAALAAMFAQMNNLARHKRVSRETFVEAFKTYFWISWRWLLLNLVVYGGIGGVLSVYIQREVESFLWFAVILIVVGIIWTLLQLFMLPMLVEMNEKRILTAIRNCAVIYLKSPGPLYGTGLIIFILVLLSSYVLYIPWLMFFGSISAYLINRTLLWVLGFGEELDRIG